MVRAALGAAVLFAGGFAYARFWMPPSPMELERLRREHRLLGERLQSRLVQQGRLLELPEASVLIGVPDRFAEGFVGDLVKGLFSELRLALRNIEVRKEGKLEARALLARRTLGRFALSVSIREINAVLRPGRPQLRFRGDRIDVTVPVSLAEGSGRGRLRFRWDGRGMAGAVCGDFDADEEVAGTVVPVSYTLKGSVRLSAEDQVLVARPLFDKVRLKVVIEPSRETWQFVDTLIQQRGAVCRAALGAVDVREKIRAALDRGINVTLPGKLLARSVRLPAAIEQSVDLEGKAVRIALRPIGLMVTPTRLWYGARAELLAAERR